MLCEHGNIAPCVECDVEPLKAQIETLRSALVEAQGASACDDGYGRVCRIVSRALEQKGSSWLLRKQAEAVEAATNEHEIKSVTNDSMCYSVALRDYAKRLRNQADELENPK